jgi:hypothetical protein
MPHHLPQLLLRGAENKIESVFSSQSKAASFCHAFVLGQKEPTQFDHVGLTRPVQQVLPDFL